MEALPGHISAVCTDLTNVGLSHVIHYPGDKTYESRVSAYWSRVAHKRPSCLVCPTTTSEVAQILKAIVRSPGCKFAVRSGGHTAWGASAIEDGITIDLGRMNTTTYDPKTELASIQPGARWEEVYRVLEPLGINVAGGRDGDVGIAGLLLGGGISWYSPRYGFACDQVQNFEVVLADGSVVNANKQDDADLWHVLKGGSFNFGIVTRFDMFTFPAEPLWGGVLVSDRSTGPAQLRALTDFNDKLKDNPDSSFVLLWNYAPPLGGTVITRFVVNTRGVVEPPELKETLAIPTMFGDPKVSTVTSFAHDCIQPYGYYNFWLSCAVSNDPEVLQKAVDLHDDVVATLQSVSKTGDFTTMALFQAVPKIYGDHSLDRGGNVMGQQEIGEDVIMFMSGVHVSEPELKGAARELALDWMAKFKAYAKSVHALKSWMYLPYADESQDPFSGIGKENCEKIKAAAIKYDPDGIFQHRAPGGFKVSRNRASNAGSDQ